jgi:hypothetical protein
MNVVTPNPTVGNLAQFAASGQLAAGPAPSTFADAAATTTALGTKQANLTAGTAGNIVTYSGTTGVWGTAITGTNAPMYWGRADSIATMGNVDLNSWRRNGIWTFPTYGIYDALLNKPPQLAGASYIGLFEQYGVTTEVPAASAVITQRFTVAPASSSGLTRVFTRAVYSAGTTWGWSPWAELTTGHQNVIRQGTGGVTYREGTHFNGPGLPSAQTFINENINNRILNATVIVEFNEEDTTGTRDLFFHNILMNRQSANVATPTYIDLKYSGGQCARFIVVRNCQCPFSIYNDGDPGDICCNNFTIGEKSVAISFAANTPAQRHVAFGNAFVVNDTCVLTLGSTNRVDCASFTVGSQGYAIVTGTMNISTTLAIHGRLNLSATAEISLASTPVVGSRTGFTRGEQSIITDNRVGRPLETWRGTSSIVGTSATGGYMVSTNLPMQNGNVMYRLKISLNNPTLSNTNTEIEGTNYGTATGFSNAICYVQGSADPVIQVGTYQGMVAFWVLPSGGGAYWSMFCDVFQAAGATVTQNRAARIDRMAELPTDGSWVHGTTYIKRTVTTS